MIKKNLAKLGNNLWLLALFLVLLYFFTKLAVASLDPDLGWHLRTAKDFIDNGIFPSYDRYSFALKNFPWPDYEFGLETVMYLIYKYFGYLGLGLVFSTITATLLTLHLYLTKVVFKISTLTIAVFAGLFILGFSGGFGIRVPVLALWMNIVLFWLIYAYLNDKLKPIICFLLFISCFFIWANGHPSFFVGLGTTAAAVVFKSWQKKRIDRLGITVLLSSTLVTLVNPYGLRLWQEIVAYFAGPLSSYNRQFIQEWRPLLLSFPVDIWGLLAFVTAIYALGVGLKNLARLVPFQLLIACGYLILTLSAIRNLSLFLVWALPLGLIALNSYQKLNLKPFHRNYAKLFSFILALLMLSSWIEIAILSINFDPLQSPQFSQNYPSLAAVAKLKEVSDYSYSPLIFDHYGWGGFLIWQFGGSPRIFIDGRMPATWYKDGVFPFKDYVQMSQDQGQKTKVFNKYNFNVAIVEKTSWKKLDFINYLLIGGGEAETALAGEAEDKSVRLWLSNNPAWHKVFSDNSAEIYVKNT